MILTQILNLLIFVSIIVNICCQTIYDQQSNPQVWGGACQTGKQQSPINLTGGKAQAVSVVFIDYDKIIGKTKIFNDGKTIEVEFLNQGFSANIIYNSQRYKIQQLHFHWGASEHAISGKLYDGEIHLVHKAVNGKILVLGVLLKKGGTINNPISQIFRRADLSLQNYPSEINDYFLNSSLRQLLNGINLQRFLTYDGSLTTPNCAEGVKWLVATETVNVNTQAISNLRKIKDKNGKNLIFTNRKLQPLNNRPIYKPVGTFI